MKSQASLFGTICTWVRNFGVLLVSKRRMILLIVLEGDNIFLQTRTFDKDVRLASYSPTVVFVEMDAKTEKIAAYF